MKTFDEWAIDQEVECEVRVKVNGQTVFLAKDFDPGVVFSQQERAEAAIAEYLNDEYVSEINEAADLAVDLERGK